MSRGRGWPGGSPASTGSMRTQACGREQKAVQRAPVLQRGLFLYKAFRCPKALGREHSMAGTQIGGTTTSQFDECSLQRFEVARPLTPHGARNLLDSELHELGVVELQPLTILQS